MGKNVPFIGYMQPVDPNAINPTATFTTNTVYIPGYGIIESQDEIRKRKVMEGLFHVGVVFKHKNSKVLWEVVEVHPDEGNGRMAIAKSRNSGYRKAIWASGYSYDTFTLIDAPQAVKILYGDEKNVKSSTRETDTNAQQSPEAAEIAFEETDLSEIDPGDGK